jgi:pimeloyl-ACP methyl ester carboxylesterase
VGIQLASRYPDFVKSMTIIAGAGLPRSLPLNKKIWRLLKIRTFKALKHAYTALGLSVDSLRHRFGSRDYASAGDMQPILTRVVNENLSEQSTRIQCRTLLIYGENDAETPPEIGQRLNALIPNSKFIPLSGEDHYSILTSGRHQIAYHIQTLLE